MTAVPSVLKTFLPFTLALLSSALQSQTVKISQDLNRIGRLRYDVYEHESRLPNAEGYLKELFNDKSNHEEKTVLDDMDRSGINFVLENGLQEGELTGCLRLNFGSLQESLGELADLMEINVQDLVGAGDQTGFYVSRLAIAPGKRGTLLTAKLCAEAFHYSRQQGCQWAYVVTSEKLTRMYKKMGFVVVAEKDLGAYGVLNLIRLDLSQEYAWLRNPKKK